MIFDILPEAVHDFHEKRARPAAQATAADRNGGSHFLSALRHPQAGTSTNKWMRIVHNGALDLGWLLAPVLARKIWPAFRTQKTIPITLEQHQRLVASEKDEEFARYFEVLWETGGAQTDIACLHRDNIDLLNRRVIFNRRNWRADP